MTDFTPWPDAERIARTVVRRHLHIRVAAFDADDVIQDVMLRLWRASPHEDGVHAHPSVVGRIAYRQLIDSLRTAHVIADHDRAIRPVVDSIDAPEFWDRTEVHAPDTAAVMDAVDLVGALPERERFCLVALAHGYKEWEIAPVLGVSQSRVSQLKRAALEELMIIPPSRGRRNLYRMTWAERDALLKRRAVLRGTG